MTECNHDCKSCNESCSDRDPKSFLLDPNPNSSVKKVFGVLSGKGGVGKSMITEQLAVLAQRSGLKVGILDADITGPSIPKAFGITGPLMQDQNGLIPVKTKTGIDVVSLNLLLEDETDPVIWRGPVITGTLTQFWTEVAWKDLDYMFIDMPPGTGDIALTVFQSLPLDGLIIVTSPQDLVSMIVEKAVKMAEKLDIPIVGIVENMSYVECPDCGKQIHIFGEGKTDEAAFRHNLDVLAKLPIMPELAAACDNGTIEEATGDWLQPVIEKLKEF